MLRKKIIRDPIAANRRAAIAARRAGVGAQCSCGESRPEALITKVKPINCAACKKKEQGKTVMDNHHVAGRANSPVTVPIHTNDHRASLSIDQYDWPTLTRENSDGCPFIAAAGCIRGFIDTVHYLVDNLLGKVPDMLEKVAADRSEQLGPKWWIGTEFEQFAPKGKRDVR